MEGVTYERSAKENLEAMRMLLDLGLDPNHANNEGRTALMGAAMKGRTDVVQLLVDRGAKLDQHDQGSRDTDKVSSAAAGHTWQALDYAEGLVRVGVQSAVARPETAALIRKLMTERNIPAPRSSARSCPCASSPCVRGRAGSLNARQLTNSNFQLPKDSLGIGGWGSGVDSPYSIPKFLDRY